jgi:hypothetical protein
MFVPIALMPIVEMQIVEMQIVEILTLEPVQRNLNPRFNAQLSV